MQEKKSDDRKYIIIGAAAVTALIVLAFNLVRSFLPVCAHISANAQASISVPGKANQTLDPGEAEQLRRIFSGKWYSSDEPSCGFYEQASVSFGGDVFMPAGDGCDTVKFNGKYTDISSDERGIIDKIFIKYGLSFPYVD